MLCDGVQPADWSGAVSDVLNAKEFPENEISLVSLFQKSAWEIIVDVTFITFFGEMIGSLWDGYF